jgi:DEAD/DEAH box helicase domain-containing protein
MAKGKSKMNFVFFDLETQKLFQDVGGRDASKLRLACGVTYSTDKNDFKVYWERDAQALVEELKAADKVVGFNIKEFDYEVLRPYAPTFSFASLRTLDLLLDISRTLGFRIPLDSLAKACLKANKTADGIQSVEWFRNGELEKVAEYCKADVDITRRVFEFGRDNGFVYYFSKLGSKLKVNVNWR